MDAVRARSKPRCRIFDRAINSVRNQSSSRIKMKEVNGLDPDCSSSKTDSPPSNVNSFKFEKESLSEVKYSAQRFEADCFYVRKSSRSPNMDSQSTEKTLSHNTSVDYNLPVSSSDFLAINPEVLFPSELIEEPKAGFTCNKSIPQVCSDGLLPSRKVTSATADCVDNLPVKDSATRKCQSGVPHRTDSIPRTLLDPFYRTEIPADSIVDGRVGNSVLTDVKCKESFPKHVPDLTSGLMFERSSKTCLLVDDNCRDNTSPIVSETTEVTESPSSNSEFSKCNVKRDDQFYEKSTQCDLPITISICESKEGVVFGPMKDSCGESNTKRMSSQRVTITIKVSDKESSSEHSFPISVQENGSGGYQLPVAILISSLGNTLSNVKKPCNVEDRASKCNIRILSKSSLVKSGFLSFVEQGEAVCAMTKAKSENNLVSNRTWGTIPSYSSVSANFPQSELLGGDIRSYELADQGFSEGSPDSDFSACTPLRNFIPEDGSGDVFGNNCYSADGDYRAISDSKILKSSPESGNVRRSVHHQKSNWSNDLDNFSPNNLCRNCSQEYSHELDSMNEKFKCRFVDRNQCSCIVSSVDKSYPSCSELSEEPSTNYSLPVFPKRDFRTLDISSYLPTNHTNDWNLSRLPDDFSLPISNQCCDLNFPLEEEENLNPLSDYDVKSFFFTDNMAIEDSKKLSKLNKDPCFEPDGKTLEDSDSRRSRLVPTYDSERLLSLKSDLKFIDTHCHLDFLFQKLNYGGSFKAYKSKHESSFPTNYGGCVAVFCNPLTFCHRVTWEKHLEEETVWATFGCHPHYSRFYNEKYEDSLLKALDHPQVRALGEIGLDYSRNNHCSREIQIKVFRRQLEITVAKKLPLVIHCRESHDDTLRLAREMLPKDQKIHLHCFTDTWDAAEKWIGAFPNLCIGFTNRITLNTDENVYGVVKKMPMDKLLLETDAPYFVPKVVRKGHRWSTPGMAIHVAAQIAAIKNIDIEEVLHWTRKNTNRVYGI